SEATALPVAPRAELLAGPLKAMIAMPEFAQLQSFEFHVVFAVRRRDDDERRPRGFEDSSLKGRQARRIEVLNDLDQSCSVETFQSVVLVYQRTMYQVDPCSLPRRHSFQLETFNCIFE